MIDMNLINLQRNQNFKLYMIQSSYSYVAHLLACMHHSDDDIVSYELTKGRKKGRKQKQKNLVHARSWRPSYYSWSWIVLQCSQSSKGSSKQSSSAMSSHGEPQ